MPGKSSRERKYDFSQYHARMSSWHMQVVEVSCIRQSYCRRSAENGGWTANFITAYHLDTIWFCGWCIYNQSCWLRIWWNCEAKNRNSFWMHHACIGKWDLAISFTKERDVSGLDWRKADHKQFWTRWTRVKVERVEKWSEERQPEFRQEPLSW